MKAMKCPECETISTFTRHWSGSTKYSAPVRVDQDGDIEIDYDQTMEGDTDDEDDHFYIKEVCCDKCGSELDLDEIKIVKAETVES